MEKTVSYLKAYFDKTNIPMQTRYRYCMYCSDINALYNHLPFDVFGTLCLAFDYGMAKGYRAAKTKKK